MLEPSAQRLNIYSNGILYCSVCAETALPLEEVEQEVNSINPTGSPTLRWSLADEPFRTGESNPHPCNHSPATHTHYLMSC